MLEPQKTISCVLYDTTWPRTWGDIVALSESDMLISCSYKDRQWNRAADAAFAEILAKQFQHSPELIASILDLHEGSMGGILDMLGQLDAESRGQLLTDPQAPLCAFSKSDSICVVRPPQHE